MKRYDAEALLGIRNFAKNRGLMELHRIGKPCAVHQKIAVCQPHGERGLLACDVMPITLSVWTVSRGEFRIQKISSGLHVRSRSCFTFLDKVIDDLLMRHHVGKN